MSKNTIPVAAKVWIARHLYELEFIHKQTETYPNTLVSALHAAELFEIYFSEFDRDLIDDLADLFPKAES